MPNENLDLDLDQTEEVVSEEETEDVVTLSRAQYDAVLDRISELEASGLRPQRIADDVDDLVQEGKRGLPQQEAPTGPVKDLEEMSNRELAQFIFDNLDRTLQDLSAPVITKVQKLEVQREIDKCEAKYDDFWDYEKEVLKIASTNPTLSVEQAYKLAKQEYPKEPKVDSKGNQRTTTERLMGLPPRRPLGEKPSMAAGATNKGGVIPLKDAAEATWREIMGASKSK